MVIEGTPQKDGMAIALERIAEEADRRTGRLSLRNLGLESLPEELFALTHLRELDLGCDWLESGSGRNLIAAQQSRFVTFRLLEKLVIERTDLSSLSPLSVLIGLQALDCSFTLVSDLSPLSVLIGLQTLDCSFTSVSDLSPLSVLSG